MLEFGRPGSYGCAKGELLLVKDGETVGVLRASDWKEQATAVVGGRQWVFAKRRGELMARSAAEPEDAVRLVARKTSVWKETWELDLQGIRCERVSTSISSGRHVYGFDGDQVAGSGRTGGWSPRPVLYAEDTVLLDHQAFLLWLELVLGRSNAAVVAGVTTAAVIGGTS